MRAVDQLGHPALDVRLGGIYSLERLARESPEHHPPIMEILAAFVREHAPWPARADGRQPAPVRRRRARRRAPGCAPRPTCRRRSRSSAGARSARTPTLRSVLPHTALAGAMLTGAHLERALLSGANLEGADLFKANLSAADLEGASLRGAGLLLANLNDTVLWGANLEGARLYGAHLEGAALKGANLQGRRPDRRQPEGRRPARRGADRRRSDRSEPRRRRSRGREPRGREPPGRELEGRGPAQCALRRVDDLAGRLRRGRPGRRRRALAQEPALRTRVGGTSHGSGLAPRGAGVHEHPSSGRSREPAWPHVSEEPESQEPCRRAGRARARSRLRPTVAGRRTRARLPEAPMPRLEATGRAPSAASPRAWTAAAAQMAARAGARGPDEPPPPH